MILLSIVLWLSVIATSFLPLLIPITFWLILQLLYLWVHWFVILCIIISASLIVWVIRYEWDKKTMTYLATKYPNIFDKKIDPSNKRIKTLSHIHNNMYLMRISTVIASRSPLPDMVLIRVVRNKMNIYQRLTSYTLGKIIVYWIVILPWEILIKFL